ncbi:helix-turn-helix transcriptional regulator [Streptomyces sp. M2CJ-2]|uniref:helix-turn-helix transcriptional regulator n=1 Tax=Streptomyces sp. M2CJ-2 TaxID=2803948 RepID=UPI0019277DD7|nr:helix-turn-helix transcriptional regulator [Streptomyces sp. M2CJ-2]MBL3670194.1 helix-turn-helix transcriptional regulator [Streptomyces sp. M2CJ-2]
MSAEEKAAAGRVAEDVFVRQMRRRRALLDLSQAELAERVAELGGSLYQQTIAKIESGQRAVRLQEADLIAQALGTTVSQMLSRSIGDATGSPAKMDIDELIAGAKAAQRRRDELAVQLAAVRAEEARAREEMHVAQTRTAGAAALAARVAAELEEAERVLREMTRTSLNRQSELNAKYGPRWREKMSIHPPITREQIEEWSHQHLEKMRELAQSTTTMNSRDREVLLKNIEDLERRLGIQNDEE